MHSLQSPFAIVIVTFIVLMNGSLPMPIDISTSLIVAGTGTMLSLPSMSHASSFCGAVEQTLIRCGLGGSGGNQVWKAGSWAQRS